MTAKIIIVTQQGTFNVVHDGGCIMMQTMIFQYYLSNIISREHIKPSNLPQI
jgi:hypothetical protein